MVEPGSKATGGGFSPVRIASFQLTKTRPLAIPRAEIVTLQQCCPVPL